MPITSAVSASASLWRLKSAVLLAGVVLAVVPSAAAAVTYDQPLPMTSSNPAASDRIDPISTPVPWEIDGSLKNTDSSLYIQVSTQNALGADGTLDNAYVQDMFSLYSFQGSGNFTGQSVGGAGRWQDTPGTYYWMASAEVRENPDDMSSPVHYYRSKVFTIRVGGPPAEPTQTQPQPQPQAQPLQAQPPQTPGVTPATTVIVHSHSVSHGHAKLRAACTPAPCTLRTISFVKVGAKWYPGTAATTTLANSLMQHFYVDLPNRTVRAIRKALKRHHRAKLYVEIDTIGKTGAVADRDFLSFGLTRVAG
jgi:hypothetical protein